MAMDPRLRPALSWVMCCASCPSTAGSSWGPVLGLILGIIASLLMTPLYRATALLELNTQATEMLDSATRPGQAAQNRGAMQDMLGTINQPIAQSLKSSLSSTIK